MKNKIEAKNLKKTAGFTLIEILVVIGIIAILAAIVIIAINPAKQFAQARNTQRQAGVNAILNAVGQRLADNKGVFAGTFTIGATPYTCPTLPNASTTIASTGGVDLACLVPTYIAQLPVDPNGGSWTNSTTYNTDFSIAVDATGRITVCAGNAVSEGSLPTPTAICVTR